MEEYDDALKGVTDGLFNQGSVLQPDDVLIFMTHSGPNDSGKCIHMSVIQVCERVQYECHTLYMHARVHVLVCIG